MVMENYFKHLRSQIGHEEIIMPGVAGILFDETRTKILLEQRGDGEIGWSLVGGMQNLNESAMTSLQREFKEEANIDVAIKALIGIDTNFHHTFPNGDKAQIPMTLFEVEQTGGTLHADGDETTQLTYVPLSSHPKMYNPQHQLAVDQMIRQAPYGWYF
ncbi:ADP-ribose pyrophosphatase YjhB (NUDIX family) [Weissella uvarum]|uniref:NUDIX domain-containing protein n=1 Tax=Weissella uvarum TaxID=1479233 RepID=UPI00195FDFE6|nr:NUDIX domain-containing protein [Weissella uvarum]MBM7616711.1 ADP-ribose pyrophosphatase YjhB (NUDIX family) [Weissella uvarum]MCM0594834.1 NUDIX domain-containing protein [Weissella uvarum]